MDESALIKRIISGEREAFRELVDKYQRLAAHIVFRMIRNADDREDICQEVFIKVYTNLKSFKGASKLSTWISKITVNTCKNYLMKKKLPLYDEVFPAAETADDIPGDHFPPDTLAEKDEISYILNDEIAKLPLNYRTAITLFHLNEMNYKEIADIMGIPIGSVKSYLFRGRKYLYDKITKRYQSAEL